MNTTMISVLTFAAVVGLGVLLLRPVFGQYIDKYAVRIRPRKRGQTGDSAEKPRESALLKLCQVVGEGLLQALPKLADERTLTLLKHANYRSKEHLGIFIGVKAMVVGSAIFVALITSAGDPKKILAGVVLAVLGWMMPNFFLAMRVKQRQKTIVSELPTVIDLMIVCAQAGLGLLSCIEKVGKETENTCPMLASELKQLISDVKIFAKSAANALADLAERCGVEELQSMSSSLIAAETKGSDISYPLRAQADALRDKMKRKKEEDAARTPVKMVPVIMFFVMPLILCPILGPAVITIMSSLGSVFGGQ